MARFYLKRFRAIPGFIACACLNLDAAQNAAGIIAGTNNGAPYLSYISTSGLAVPVSSSLLPSTGAVNSVAINPRIQAIIAGADGSQNGFAYFVNSPSSVTPLFTDLASCTFQAVAINNRGNAVVGAYVGGLTPMAYAAAISSSGIVTEAEGLSTSVSSGVGSVSINNYNAALVGGQNANNNGLAAFFYSSGETLPFHVGPPPSFFTSVDLNDSGVGILGGSSTPTSTGPYASLVSSTGVETLLTGGPLPAGPILSVSIDLSNNGIIGGYDSMTGEPYAALVSADGNATNLTGLPASGQIKSVSINPLGTAIIGGSNGAGAYAALVSPSGSVTSLSMPSPGVINSVDINENGAGLVGGQTGSEAYAALITPSGQVITIPGLPNIGNILSVSVLSHIPTFNFGANTNNQSFARYINQNAPQDVFYFIPSFFTKNLNSALESSAPTRNALSVFAASQNVFFLNQSLSFYLRKPPNSFKNPLAATLSSDWIPESSESELLVFSKKKCKKKPALCEPCGPVRNQDEAILPLQSVKKEPPWTLWFDGVGIYSAQKSQSQTVGFQPYGGGAILAVDRNIAKTGKVGGGSAYLFTHVAENQNAGHSSINQEFCFFYGSWNESGAHIDGAVWMGLFQTKQLRNIQMTGFNFTSTSTPSGAQISPHLEVGYNRLRPDTVPQYFKFSIDTFVMADWVNTWQKRYKEKGSGPFNSAVVAQHSSFLRTEAGFRFYEGFLFSSWMFLLEEKLSFVNKTPFHVGRVTGFLIGSPGSFTLETLSTSQNLGAIEISFLFEPFEDRYPAGSVSYQGEFNDGSYQSHQATFEASWRF